MTTSLRRNLIVAAATGGLVLAGAAVAFAAIPNPATGVISGCYTNTTPHVLRVIDTAKTPKCPTGTTAINWNQKGPQGLPGLSENRVTTTSGPKNVPSYVDETAPNNGRVKLLSVQITVTGTGPQLFQIEALGSAGTLPQQPFQTPCGQYFSFGQILVEDAANTQVGSGGTSGANGVGNGSSSVMVPGPGTYTFNLNFWPTECANPNPNQGVLTLPTTALGLSVTQL